MSATTTNMTDFGNISEQEIRSIIRRRIVFEELRHSTAQKMILSEVTSGLTISSFKPLSTILSSVPFVDDATMAAILPWLITTAEAVLFGSGAVMAASMMPGGFLLKTYAFAKVCTYGYMFHKLVTAPFVEATTDIVNPKQFFLSSNRNSCKNFVEGFANFIATKEDGFVMPQLQADFESTNNLTPGTSTKNDYQQSLNDLKTTDLDPANVDNFLGINLTQFNGTSSGNFKTYPDSMTPSSGMNSIYHSIANSLVKEAIEKQDGDAVINKLAEEFDNYNLTVHDLYFVDEYFGRTLVADSDVTWKGESVMGATFKIDMTDDFRISEGQYIRNAINDPDESCIYYAINNFATMEESVGDIARSLDPSGIIGDFFGADTEDALTKGIGVDTDNNINDKMRNIFNIENIIENQNRYARIMMSKSDLLDRVRPYVGGDTSRVEAAIASSPDGSTYINRNFPAALKASILDVIKIYGEKARIWINAAWEWIKTQVSDITDDIINLWDNNIHPKLGQIAALISGDDIFETIYNILKLGWDKLVEFFSKLTSTESKGGDDSEEPSSGSSQKASSKNSQRTVRRMQNLMNRHIEKTGSNIKPTELNGVWSGDTTRVFNAITGEAFATGIFKDDPDADQLSQGGFTWPEMSKMLNDKNGPKYTKYTPDEEGAFEMIRDIYYNETGNVDDQDIDTEFIDNVPDDRDRRGTRGEGGRLGRNNIGVEVIAGNTTDDELEKIGFPEETTNTLTDAVITSIKSMNHTGGMVVLKVIYARKAFGRYDKGEVINIKKDETQSRARMINYRFLRRKIKEILTSSNSRVDVDSIKNRRSERGRKGRFTLVLRIPPGAKRF